MEEALRPEERISGPTQIPLSSINKRSRVGFIAHTAVANGWQDVGVYQCINYTGDVVQKNGKIRRGKVEPHVWTTGRMFIDGKQYAYKHSDILSWINKAIIDYEQLKRTISGECSPRDILIERENSLLAGD